jgi:redox-sensing transcriptional repressor
MELYVQRLWELKAAGRTEATSEALASVAGVSASRVRQDMMAIRMSGRPRSGYRVDDLGARIYEALDLVHFKAMALVGCGNLGSALLKSRIWVRAGFIVRAAFDNSPSVVGSEIAGLTVQPMSALNEVVAQEDIAAACVTVPENSAQPVIDALVAAGVRGIWNFASKGVVVPPDVVLENQRLEHGLMTLSCLMHQRICPDSGAPSDPEESPNSGNNA